MFWNKKAKDCGKSTYYWAEKRGEGLSVYDVKSGSLVDIEHHLSGLKRQYKLYSDGELYEKRSYDVYKDRKRVESEVERLNKNVLQQALKKVQKLKDKLENDSSIDDKHVCEKCDKFFDTEMGLAIHNGHMHG